MNPHSAAILIAFGLAELILLWVALSLRRKERLIADLPQSKVQGVFIGLVELNVAAETEKPVTGLISGEPCVFYSYQVLEHWSRVVVETTTDDKGQTHTETRREEGWSVVGTGGEMPPFYGKDDTGVILIRPEGAKVEGASVTERMAVLGDPLYFGIGNFPPVAGSTGRRRFIEGRIPLHTPLFVIGQARERSDVVAPEIAASKDAALFVISALPRSAVERGYSVYSWLAWFAGACAAAVPGAILGWTPDPGEQPRRALWFGAASVAVYLFLWIAGWALMVYNSLVGLRQRVQQGWSLIDVQLKRRSDLIPGLVSAVSALSSHEHDVQQAVASLRSQQAATRPGQPGPDPTGVAGTLRAVAEKYPELVAQASFSKLQTELIETEQRIALARTYYNDIATQMATRSAQIPDRWLAGLAGIEPEPLLSAADFERAAVKVSLAGAPP